MFSRAITAPGCSGSSPALLQFLFFWAANFGSEVPALTRRELSANLRQPTKFEDRAASFNSEAVDF